MDTSDLKDRLIGVLGAAVSLDDGVLSVDLAKIPELPSVADLVSAVTGEPAPLPPELMALISPDIQRLELGVDLRGQTTFDLGLVWPDGWTLLPDLLEVQHPSLRLARRSRLLDPGFLRVEGAPARHGVESEGVVSGHIEAFGLGLDAQILLPSLQGSLQTSPDDSLSLGPLLARMHLGGSPLDTLALQSAHLLVNPTLRVIVFGLAIGDMEIGLGAGSLTLEELAAELRYRAGPTSSLAVSLSTSLALALPHETVRLHLAADREGAGTGWKLAGGLALDPPVGLLGLLGSVLEQIGGPDALADPPVDLDIATIDLTYDTHAKDVTVHARGDLELGATLKLPMQVDVAVTHPPGGGVDKRLSGRLDVPISPDHTLTFEAGFSSDSGADAATGETVFGAAYADERGTTVGLGDLVATVDADATDELVSGLNALSFTLHGATLAMLRSKGPGPAKPAKYLFAADVDGGLDLTALPLVGDKLPRSMRLSMEFSPLYASEPFQPAEIQTVRALLPRAGDISAAAHKGMSLGLALVIGDKRITFGPEMKQQAGMSGLSADALRVPKTAGGAVPPIAPMAPALPPATQPAVKWIDIQKRLGPISLQRVGVGFAMSDQTITVLLDASLGLAGLEFSLMGLGASYRIADRQLTFHLDGLGLTFKKGPIDIEGAFLRMGPDSYVGEAKLQMAAFSLGALGAYGKVDGHTSVFIYAFLDAPLGGPVFFFVEGLAFGFGYNRDLIVPPIKDINSFPLVSEVMGTTPPSPVPMDAAGRGDALRAKMGMLATYLRPTVGQNFIAVGLKFSSFELIDCFALAAVSFGREFKIDVIGVATASIPPKSPEMLAFIELNFAIAVHPAEGFIGAEAALSSRSFVLSPDCHLTGGFAFYTWMKTLTWHGHPVRAGDFVVTLGGYHPQYVVPAHYPRVDPLGLNWRLSAQMWIKGGLYFAVTPDALMAGGKLQAHFAGGPLRADFLMGADFMMQWKPFHYQGRAYIEVSVAFDAGLFDIKGSFGAELKMWGPEFAGTARLHLGPVSASVAFGAADKGPPPLTWAQFHTSFMPADGGAGTRIAQGLRRTLPLRDASGEDRPDKTRQVIDPKRFAVETHSVAPLTAATWNGGPIGAWDDPDSALAEELGVLPMGSEGVGPALASTQRLIVTRDGEPVGREQFTVTRVGQGFPAALWGGKVAATADAAAALLGLRPTATVPADKVINAAAGVRIEPAHPARAGLTLDVAREALDFETYAVHLRDDESTADGPTRPSVWPQTPDDAPAPPPPPPPSWRDQLVGRMARPGSQGRRRDLLRTMGYANPAMHFDPRRVADGLIVPPAVIGAGAPAEPAPPSEVADG